MPKQLDRINVGFVSIFAVLAILLSFWVISINNNNKLLELVVSENRQTQLIHKLVHAMHNRTIVLYRMTATEDAFAADEQLLVFMQLAEEFMKTRELVLSGDATDDEKQLWQAALPFVIQSQKATNEVLKLISDGDTTRAIIALDSSVKPTQELVAEKLNKLIQYQVNEIDKKFNRFRDTSKTTYAFVVIMFLILFVIAVLIMITLRNKHGVESELIRQGERIRTLYEISAISGMSIDEQINETLNYGRTLLDTEVAKVSLIDVKNNSSTITHIVAPDEMLQGMPMAQPLSNTFCSVVYTTEKPLALHHIATSEYQDHPSYKRTGIETYAAVPIWVNEEKYGTVCFANRKPRQREFSEIELDLIRLISRWISVNIERQKSQQVEMEKKEAVAANKAKSDFLANMSHEIRTPLNAIIGFAEASLYMNPSRQELDNSLQTIVRSGHHLLHLINNILDLSKIESGHMDVERIRESLFSILLDVEMLMRPRVEEKGLVFKIDYVFPLPVEIETDPVKLKQVLLNLCSNAIKFTHDGQIKLEVAYLSELSRLHIAVIDSGIGLTEEQQKQIFKPFTQADVSTTRKYGGTGLGLSLSRQFVSMLGGELIIKSQSGIGSRFEFDINIGDVDAASLIRRSDDIPKLQPLLQEQSKYKAKSGHVLIVDDIEENQQLMQLYVKKLGLDTSIANNGKEALELINANQQAYDLILMDMQMPVMDGYTAVETLRAQGYQQPIVALTADVMLSNKEKCLACGCNDFLSKPVERDKLENVMARFLQLQQEAGDEETIVSKLLADDSEFAELVKEFNKRLPRELEIIQTDINNKNWEEMTLHLHTLIGVAANLGYKSVAKLLREMEASLKQSDYGVLDSFIPKLADEFNQIA